ncbi:MAG: phosphoribosylformylglycinamidine synthase subunit PurS [Rickettsiales bacterium]|jgi:phosphoribosylformylglycinamidine synthase PurS subunit
MKVKVHVTLKNGVLDPQGKAVGHALEGLGFNGIGSVRIGRYIELDLDESDPEKARQQSEEMCKKLLANTVIENYRIEIEQ